MRHRCWVLLLALSLVGAVRVSGQPAAGEADLARGKDLFLQGDFAGAKSSLRLAAEAVESSDSRLDARLTLALIAQAEGDDARMLIELQWALVEDADLQLDPDVYSPKTRQAFAQARERAFERLLQAKKDFAVGSLALALEEFHLAAGLLERDVAEGQIENLLDAYLSCALIYQTRGEPDASREAFRKALSVRPELELDGEFYSPSTIEIFDGVKKEGDLRLQETRAAIEESKLDGADSILDASQDWFLAPGQRDQAAVLRAYVRFLRGDAEAASSALEAVLATRLDIGLDEAFFDSEFLVLATNARIVVTRGLPSIAVLQSSDAVVHRLAREGFEAITVANYEEFVLPEDRDLFEQRGAGGIDLVYALGDEALALAIECCPALPLVAGNLTGNAPSLGDESFRGAVLWNASLEAQIPVALRALPNLTRVGAIAGPGPGQSLLSELRTELAARGVELVSASIDSIDDVGRALDDVLDDAELFWYLPDPSLASVDVFQAVRTRCDERGKPIFAFHESLVEGGAFVGVSADFRTLGRRAGRMALDYLSSRDDASLRTVPGDASRVVVNLDTANRLGIEPDPALVSLAVTVYR